MQLSHKNPPGSTQSYIFIIEGPCTAIGPPPPTRIQLHNYIILLRSLCVSRFVCVGCGRVCLRLRRAAGRHKIDQYSTRRPTPPTERPPSAQRAAAMQHATQQSAAVFAPAGNCYIVCVCVVGCPIIARRAVREKCPRRRTQSNRAAAASHGDHK